MTAQDQKIAYLDGWRGLAIVLVLLSHFGPAGWGPIAKFGVTLFFVLSGLFMGKLLFIKKVRLDSFFVRRFTRVLPALWVFLGAMIAWAQAVQPMPYAPSGAEVISAFTFLGAYFPSDISIWANHWPISHLWSLNVEEHAYIFLALIAVACARLKGNLAPIVVMALAVVASVGLSYFYGKFQAPDGASPWFVRSECAALGIVAAACYNSFLYHYAPAWIPRLAAPALACVVLAALIFTPLAPDTRAKTFLMVIAAPLLCAFAVNHAAGFPQAIKNLLNLRVLRWFGTCSFSIYLWQQPLYLYAHETTMPVLACLSIALGLGFLSFRCIENPLRIHLNAMWEERLLRRATPMVVATKG